MTNEDFMKLAQEAGWDMPTELVVNDGVAQRLERFAALVAAAEREACAQICEARFMGDLNREDMEARRCAAAIRARGEQ